MSGRLWEEQAYKTIIPRNVKISEAPSHGQPVILYDSHCIGSEAYINLAAEVLEKEILEEYEYEEEKK